MSSKNKTSTPPASGATLRPPIVVVMGHIDHGKSTLLDYIRQTKVTASEVGGITQAINAYEISQGGSKITFIDTPGHEAFQEMRQRGAKLADIAILIISAEEGVKPQTLEALRVIQEQKLSYLVAINKIDRPNANPNLVKQQLAEQGVMVEGYGGTVPWVAISAVTGQGVDELLELLLLTAQLAELKSQPTEPARGLVLEARLDSRQGNMAVLIIRDGTLNLGDYLVVGASAGKVKILKNYLGEAVKSLGPSAPALVAALSALPAVGAEFQVYGDRASAEQAAAAAQTPVGKSSGNGSAPTAEVIIPLIIKAEVSGSLAAIIHEVTKLQSEVVKFKILSSEAGAINETDIKTAAAATGALIVGFQVKATKAAQDLAEHGQVKIETFAIIYKLAEWLAAEVKRRTPLRQTENILGEGKILKTFSSTKNKQVIGGSVQSGELIEGRAVKIMRRGTEIGLGRLQELQQQKLRVKSVPSGSQFGALVEAKTVIATGDTLVAYELVNK